MKNDSIEIEVTQPKIAKRIIGIGVVCLLVIFIVSCLIYMAWEDLGNVLPLMELYLSPCD